MPRLPRAGDVRCARRLDVSSADGIALRRVVLQRRSIREEVADGLRAALVAGQMRPGVVYSARNLAAQFGVSVTPVREALLDLAKEGLVQPVRNKGFRVTELLDSELDEITELRALIEVPTIAKVVAQADIADIEALRPLAERIRSAATAKDLIEYVEADRQFHLSLLALAGNDRLVGMAGELRAQSRLYALPKLADEGALDFSVQEHFHLLEAVLRRDSVEAERVMRAHIGHVRGIWAATLD